MLKKASTLLEVMRAGRRFRHPEALKNITVLSGFIVAFIGPALAAIEAWTGVKIDVTPEQQEALSGHVASLAISCYGLFVVYSTVATTNKIGLPFFGRADNKRP